MGRPAAKLSKEAQKAKELALARAKEAAENSTLVGSRYSPILKDTVDTFMSGVMSAESFPYVIPPPELLMVSYTKQRAITRAVQ